MGDDYPKHKIQFYLLDRHKKLQMLFYFTEMRIKVVYSNLYVLIRMITKLKN